MSDAAWDRSCDEEHADAAGHLLDELQSLLNSQIEQAGHGNLATVDALAERAGQLVERLTRGGAAEAAELKAGKAAVQNSYRNLLLALAAAQQDIAGRLSGVGQRRRLVRAYRGHGA